MGSVPPHRAPHWGLHSYPTPLSPLALVLVAREVARTRPRPGAGTHQPGAMP